MATQIDFTEAQLREVLKAKLLSGEIERDEAEAAVAEYQKAQTPKGNWATAVWEPTKAIGMSVLGDVVAGYSGLFKLATGQGLDAAAATVTGIQEDVAEMAAPKTRTGQAGLENVADLVDMGIDVTQFTVSGLAGLAELVSGQDQEQIFKTVQDVKTKGVAQTAGDRAYEATGSPLFATAAYLSPELLASIVPAVHQAKKASKFQASMANRLRDAEASPAAGRNIAAFNQQIISGELVDDLYPAMDNLIQTSPPRIQQQLIGVAEDIKAGVDKPAIIKQLDDISAEAATPYPDKTIVNYVQAGANKVKTDPLALDSIKQGFDEGVIAAVKAANPSDRAKMQQMVNIRESVKKNPLLTARPADVAGNSLLERVNHVKAVNRKAGADLDVVAKGLKGQPVQFDSAVNNFVARLDDMEIKIGDDLKPIFQGSDIEGATAAENVINKVINRMTSGELGNMPDAYDLHRLKKYIDEQVTYGKTAEGLTGNAERVLKGLRRDLDGILDAEFPEYNAVNTTYADTVGALDSLQTVAGKKMDLFGDNADKAVGTLLRRLMSNTQSRVNLMDSVNEIEAVTRKYGGVFDDNIQVQMLFADELDSVFGPVARTAFQRSVGEGVKYGIEAATGQKTGLGMLADAAGALANKARGINDENAFLSIRKLLERN